ncbi:MAG: hypothetical protein PHG83_00145 [Patescibacteria group bacterium]|nr:hypothetical protein [Patescibacteria group bacterium]
MVSELEEQERRREFLRAQQQSRIGESLPEANMAAPEESTQKMDRTEAASAETISEGESSSPMAVSARLKADRAQEATKTEIPGGEALTKVEDFKKAAQRLKTIFRIINGASAITLVGLVGTFSLMNAQLIFGNLLKTKFLPALDLWEIIVLGILWFIFVVVLLFLILLLTIGTNPWKVCELLLTDVWQSVKSFFSPS